MPSIALTEELMDDRLITIGLVDENLQPIQVDVSSLTNFVGWTTGLGGIVEVQGASDEALDLRAGAGQALHVRDSDGTSRLEMLSGGVTTLRGAPGQLVDITANTASPGPTNVRINAEQVGQIALTVDTVSRCNVNVAGLDLGQYRVSFASQIGLGDFNLKRHSAGLLELADNTSGLADFAAKVVRTHDETTDVAPTDLTLRGGSAFASAVTNQDGGNVVLEPGASASGGGSDGVVEVKGTMRWADALGVNHLLGPTDGNFLIDSPTGTGNYIALTKSDQEYLRVGIGGKIQSLANFQMNITRDLEFSSASRVGAIQGDNATVWKLQPGSGNWNWILGLINSQAAAGGNGFPHPSSGGVITRPTLAIQSELDPDTDDAEQVWITWDGIRQGNQSAFSALTPRTPGVMETDRAVTDFTISAVGASPGATVNQDGASIVLVPGAKATGGGSTGVVRIGPASASAAPVLELDNGDGLLVRLQKAVGQGLVSFVKSNGQPTDAVAAARFRASGTGGQQRVVIDGTTVELALGNAGGIKWSSTTDANGTKDVGLARAAAGILALTDGTSTPGAVLESAEVSAPAAPAANGFRLYAEDNGAGKTRLMVLFATGAAQQIAIEP